MPIDFIWQSYGDLLLDGSGDIASTEDRRVSNIDMIQSRVKAALNGWKLYAIGADLQTLIGNTQSQEIELRAKQLITTALTKSFLSASQFKIQTISDGTTLKILVYLQDQLVVFATVDPNQGLVIQ